MKISKEIFVKPTEGSEFLIYSPLSGKVSIVNQGFLSELKLLSDQDLNKIDSEKLQIFREAGIISEEEKIPESQINSFEPTSLTIFPTSDCNLRCLYCYGDGGDEKKNISLDDAKTGIDLIIENALRLGRPGITVGFHGGGEPTYAWNILTESVEYAQKRSRDNNLKLRTSTASNGVLSENKLEWIVSNMNRVQLSMDGPRDIQNRQRPLYRPAASGFESSYDAIMSTIARFHQENFPFGIRATITRESVGRMEEISDFFIRVIGAKSIHLEPLYECGRCSTTNSEAPTPEEFCDNYCKALDVAEKEGIQLYTSTGNIDKVKTRFCGAAGNNFCLTPEGFVSSCYEVSLRNDPRSKNFLYGKYADGKIEIDEQKRQTLLSRTIENMQYCQDCFVKWGCAGDCLAKVDLNGNMFNTENYNRCEINRMMAEKMIQRKLIHYGDSGK